MPPPFSPPFVQIIADLVQAIQDQTVAIQALEAQTLAQQEHIERMANLQRYQLESFYGPNASVTGIWDGTDRYTST